MKPNIGPHAGNAAVGLILVAFSHVLACAETARNTDTATVRSTPDAGRKGDLSGLLWRSERVCGVNCLYLLLKIQRLNADYRGLEAKLVRNDLTSLTDLKDAAVAGGLSAVIAKTDSKGLRSLPTPLIAHLDFVSGRGETSGHFVLVTSVNDEGVHCIDGTTAQPRTFTWTRFERDWSGHLLIEARPHRRKTIGLMLSAGVLLAFLSDRLWRSMRANPAKGDLQ